MAQNAEKPEPSGQDQILAALQRIEKKVEILTLIVVLAILIGVGVGVAIVPELGVVLLAFILVPLFVVGGIAGGVIVGIRFLRKTEGSGGREERDEEAPREPAGNPES